MSGPRRLPQAAPNAVGLGQATIMDRALAAQYGVTYVHLSAFAIDVDRVFMATDDETELPFGWEVLLCLAYILRAVDSEAEEGRGLLEESCAHVLSFAPGDAPLGSLLAFAVYVGARCGRVNAALLSSFSSWKTKGLRQLEAAAREFLVAPDPVLQHCARHCIDTAMTPPVSPPTLAVLREMAAGTFRMPASAS